MMFWYLFFSVFALADSSGAGTYKFSGEPRVSVAVRYEVVAAGSPRLAELQAAHQECFLAASGTYRCRCAFCGEGPAAASALARVKAELTGRFIRLEKPWGKPSLTYRGDSYEEWQIPQAIQFLGTKSDRWRLMKLPNVVKGVIGNPTIDGWIIDREGFVYVSNTRVQESRSVLWTYLVESRFLLTN